MTTHAFSHPHKNQRIDVRTTVQIKKALMRAAHFMGISISHFLIGAAYIE